MFNVVVVLLMFAFVPISMETANKDQFDLVLVIDRSGSINDNDFNKMMDVIAKLPAMFPLGTDESAAALVSFGSDVVRIFTLDTNTTTFLQSVEKIRSDKTGGYTSTNLALKAVRDNVLAYERPEAPDVVIIVTDGCTNPADDQSVEGVAKARNDAESMAMALRAEKDALIILFKVGNVTCPVEHMNKIALDNVFPIEDFNRLEEEIFKKTRTVAVGKVCEFKEICVRSGETCKSEWWRTERAKRLACPNEKPTAGDACKEDDCDQQCVKFKADNKCDDYCNEPGICTACKKCIAESPIASSTAKPTATTDVSPSGGAARDNKGSSGEKTESLIWPYIVVGVAVLILLTLLLVLAFFVVRRRRVRKRQRLHVLTTGGGESSAVSSARSMTDKSAAVNSMTAISTGTKQTRAKSRKPTEAKGYRTMASNSTFKPTVVTGPVYRLNAESGKTGAPSAGGRATKETMLTAERATTIATKGGERKKMAGDVPRKFRDSSDAPRDSKGLTSGTFESGTGATSLASTGRPGDDTRPPTVTVTNADGRRTVGPTTTAGGTTMLTLGERRGAATIGTTTGGGAATIGAGGGTTMLTAGKGRAPQSMAHTTGGGNDGATTVLTADRTRPPESAITAGIERASGSRQPERAAVSRGRKGAVSRTESKADKLRREAMQSREVGAKGKMSVTVKGRRW